MKYKELTTEQTNKRLDILENVKTGACFFFDHTTNQGRFVQDTVDAVLTDGSLTNVVIYFKQTVSNRKAKYIGEAIGIRLKRARRFITIDGMLSLPPEHYDALIREYNITPHELAITVQTFIEKLNALRKNLSLSQEELVAYLDENLNISEEFVEYLAQPREPKYHQAEDWEISVTETEDLIEKLTAILKNLEENSDE